VLTAGGGPMGFTYAATAVIKADTGSTEPTQAELELWNSRHTKLLSSPQTYDQAAKKFAQQRVDQLSSVDDVQKFFGARLNVSNAIKGELTLRLRADNASEAANALRTFVETVVSSARATRVLQGNAYETSATEPKADPDPLTGSVLWARVWSVTLGLLAGVGFWFACHRFRRAAATSKEVEVNPALPAGFLREPTGGRSVFKVGVAVPSAVSASVSASVAGIKGLGKHLTKGGGTGKKVA
jgi:hypothetical protein